MKNLALCMAVEGASTKAICIVAFHILLEFPGIFPLQLEDVTSEVQKCPEQRISYAMKGNPYISWKYFFTIPRYTCAVLVGRG